MALVRASSPDSCKCKRREAEERDREGEWPQLSKDGPPLPPSSRFAGPPRPYLCSYSSPLESAILLGVHSPAFGVARGCVLPRLCMRRCAQRIFGQGRSVGRELWRGQFLERRQRFKRSERRELWKPELGKHELCKPHRKRLS